MLYDEARMALTKERLEDLRKEKKLSFEQLSKQLAERGVNAVYDGQAATGYSNASREYFVEIYRVDGGDWQPYAGPLTVTADTEGTVYTFRAASASGVESESHEPQ